VVVQLGAGVSQAILVMSGGLLAAALHSYFESKIRPFGVLGCPAKENCTVDRKLKMSYSRVAAPLFVCLVLAIAALEFFFPWKTELDPKVSALNDHATSVLRMRAWPPYVAGMIVGMLQLPAMFALTVTLGSASSYATAAINLIYVVNHRVVESSSFMTSLRTGIALWQPTYLFGAMIGAFISSSLSGSWGSVPSLNPVAAVLGGFLLIMGSRLAGGCTSGHGISGMAQLSSLSFVAVPVMFMGAISTAFILHAIGFLP